MHVCEKVQGWDLVCEGVAHFVCYYLQMNFFEKFLFIYSYVY